MICPARQPKVAPMANEATKVEDKKVKIAKQLENGEYKLDLKATAQAVTDALL